MSEFVFLAAVCITIAVLVGMCVREGLLERNRRLVAPDDLSSLRTHSAVRSACRSGRAGEPTAGSRLLAGGVPTPARPTIDRGARTAHITRVAPPCGLQVASTSDPLVDWEELQWA